MEPVPSHLNQTESWSCFCCLWLDILLLCMTCWDEADSEWSKHFAAWWMHFNEVEFCWTWTDLWWKYCIFSCETMPWRLDGKYRLGASRLQKNDSQFHQKLLFACEKSLWNVTWAFELYKKPSQWGCGKAAAKHSLCNQDLGDGSPRWWQALWEAPGGQQSAYLRRLVHSPVTKQQPSPYTSRTDLLCWEKQHILQVVSCTVSVPLQYYSTEKVKYYSRNEPFRML